MRIWKTDRNEEQLCYGLRLNSLPIETDRWSHSVMLSVLIDSGTVKTTEPGTQEQYQDTYKDFLFTWHVLLCTEIGPGPRKFL